MKNIQLDPRLSAAAQFYRSGKRFADIGTDHAYLPIYLCMSAGAPCGVASDINAGPIERARINIADSGLNGRIDTLLTDGLSGIEAFSPEDIFILGMGGELIRDIISKSAFIKNAEIRLILQPMTHAEKLRAYLLSNGFRIDGEALLRDGKRFYQIIAASYDGICRKWTPSELVIGSCNIQNGGEILSDFIEYLTGVYSRNAEAMERAGADASYERALLAELDRIK